MSTISLIAKSREATGKKGRALLDDKQIPAVVYGPKSKNKNITLSYSDLVHAFEEAGQSSLVDLAIDDKDPVKVIIHDLDKNPVSDRYIHVDFYELDMSKKLKVEVILEFIGESPAVKEKNAEVRTALNKITVECLPESLVKQIEVDISVLADLGNSIYTKDIKLPEGLSLTSDPNLIVTSVEEIREEIIEAPVEEKEEEKEGEEKTEEGKEGEDKKEEGKKGEDTPDDKAEGKKEKGK